MSAALRSARKCYTYNKNAAYEEELRREEERRLLKRVRRETRYRGLPLDNEDEASDLEGLQEEEVPLDGVSPETVNDTIEIKEEKDEVKDDPPVQPVVKPVKKKLGRKRHGLKLSDLDVIGRKRKHTILRKKGVKRGFVKSEEHVEEAVLTVFSGGVEEGENSRASPQVHIPLLCNTLLQNTDLVLLLVTKYFPYEQNLCYL